MDQPTTSAEDAMTDTSTEGTKTVLHPVSDLIVAQAANAALHQDR